LPNGPDDYAKGKSLYVSWAKKIVELGGSVSGEHGIGKLKVPFLELMYGPHAVAEMRELKRLFDPQMMLNPGDMFPVV
ncbi:MAG: FAD-binding oxidoreductase, partial [Armatimonadota bacterium]